jgi:hypothetical protein
VARGTWAPPGPSPSPVLECSTPFRHVACTRVSGRCRGSLSARGLHSSGVGGSARVRPRGGGEVVGRPPLGIEVGRAVAGPDRTAVPSLGPWLRWAHGLRRFAELGLVGLDELGLAAGLDERLLPESGGGAVGKMLFGVKAGNGGLGSQLGIGVAPDHSTARSYEVGLIRDLRIGRKTENFSYLALCWQ